MAVFGQDMFGHDVEAPASSILAKRYIVPPFDVLDGRSGDWRARKALWNAIPGFDSSAGRDGADAWNSTALANGLGAWLESVDNVGARTDFAHGWNQHRVSVFCPVLAETIITWFTEPGALVFDPFAGGSVRGIVAALLGRRYVGLDLSARQCEENQYQAAAMGLDESQCAWIAGDAFEAIQKNPHVQSADLIFSCPPYGTLERYSDHPDDLSTMDWREFSRRVGAILQDIRQQMKAGAWVAMVVADYREKQGGRYTALRPLVSEVAQALSLGPLELHASCVYLTPLGTLPIRAAHNFKASAKLGRAHQNVVIARKAL